MTLIKWDMENENLNNEGVQKLFGKKVLITGASGFIGQHLCKKLINNGAIVHGTSRYQKSNEIEFKDMYWWQGSFDDLTTAKKILKKSRPDYIFHLAGDVTASNDLKHVISTYNSLLTSTINLLSEALDMGCEKIVITGSSTEPKSHKITPSSPYAAAKLATVSYASLFQQLYEMPVVLIRPFMGYGPSQPRHKLIPHVIMSLLNGKSPKLTSGRWEVDWIYIDDLVDGIITATTHPEIINSPLELGSGKLTSVKEIVEKVVEILGTDVQPVFGVLPDRFSEEPRLADIHNTYDLINWKPKVSLEKGLRKTIQWFKENERVLKHAYVMIGYMMYKLNSHIQSNSIELGLNF